MVHGSPSFIDVVALPAMRDRFARGEALVALSEDLETILWANGPGAVLLGFPDIEAAIGAPLPLGTVARRQIIAASGFPQGGRERPAAVRMMHGLASRTVILQVSVLELPSADRAILLAQPAQADPQAAAERAIAGIAQPGQFAALLDREGRTIAASSGFAELGLPAARLASLAAEADSDRSRPLKRMIETGLRAFPAGYARLTDDLGLLIVIDEGEPAHSEVEEPADGHAAEGLAPPFEAPAPGDPGDMEAAAPLPDVERHARDRRDPPLRFTWQMDTEARFRSISPEFMTALGLEPDALLGRSFQEVADAFGLDADGGIAALLAERHTWSGRSVLWPIADGRLAVPVDLAALPTFGRGRVFQGYRGFGVARLAEAAVLEEPSAAEPSRPEQPGGISAEAGISSSEPRVLLETQATAPLAEADGLAPHERSAFREIGERLRAEKGDHAPEHTEALARDEAAPAAAEPGDEAAELASPEATAAISTSVDQPMDGEPEPAAAARSGGADVADVEREPVTARVDDGAESVPGSHRAEPASSEPADAWKQEGGTAPAVAVEASPGPELTGGEPPRSPKPWARDGGFFLPHRSQLPFADGAQRGPAPVDTALLDRLPIPVLIHSGDLLHYANDEFFALTGYRDLEALRAAGGLDALFSTRDGSAKGDSAENCRVCLRAADESEIPVDAILRSVPWQGGKALMLVFRRIEPAAEETALRAELEQRLNEMRTIIDTATDGVALIAADGTIRSISRPAEALFGIDAALAQGKPFGMLFALESQRVVAEYLGGLSENGVASVLNDGREVIGREKDGGFIPLFMTIGKLPANSGFCAVLRDITPWKRAEEELTQSRAKAERASSHKTEFLARVSHEIRTPLNAIIGFSELMLDEKFGQIANERYKDYLRDINRSGNHVLDIVNDLLDISKIEAGQQEMASEAVALNDALTETIATMQPQANRQRVIIRSSLAPKLPDVLADLRSVRQIALNILSNAVRYTPAGGQVIASTALEPSGDVALRVRDTGIGMSTAEIEQALKPFKQINALKRSRGDGTGLGLPLTKAMVEANRARFAITSTPGEGTLVEVIFPAARVLAE